jgi:hypothetical protein
LSPATPGERSFVDYCDGIALTDPASGEKVPTELFVGALGASSYTFAMASLSQELPAWLDSHVRMYEHLGLAQPARGAVLVACCRQGFNAARSRRS